MNFFPESPPHSPFWKSGAGNITGVLAVGHHGSGAKLRIGKRSVAGRLPAHQCWHISPDPNPAKRGTGTGSASGYQWI